jgi:hypothetical protein
MRVKIITEIDEFLQISEIWSRKYDEHKNISFFQSFDWNYHWFINNLSNDNLFILLFYDQDYMQDSKLICPTFIDKKGCLRFISDIHSDLCDVISENISKSDCIKITDLFAELVFSTNEIKKVNLINFSLNNSLVYILLKKINYNYYYSQIVSSAFFNLEDGKIFPNSAQHFKSSNRKRINKNIKKFLQYDSKLINSTLVDFPEVDILRLRDYMVNNKYRKLDFFNDKMINTIKELYVKQLVEINMVSHAEEVKSIIIIFKNQQSYQLWVSLYVDQPHISIFTINSFLQLVKGDVRIDLGRGMYDFKIMNYAPDVTELNEFFFSKNRFSFLIKIIIVKLKEMVKKIINFRI